MDIKKFENSLIAFDFESDLVNATDMLKAFPEKKMNNFLRLEQTKNFIKVLEEKMSSFSDTLKSASNENQVLIVKKGKSNNYDQGTWMHKLLAYKFAAWLNPNFELFVYSVFDEAIKKYIQETKEKLESQQRQLDYFWDKSDNEDLYYRKK